MEKVAPSERLRPELDEALAGVAGEQDPIETIGRLGARLILKQALEGRKVLLGLALGSRESYESWLSFGRNLIDRGLRAPALVIADGAPVIWKAVRELWPGALEQRCTLHALRNVTGKLAERQRSEVKARWWRIFDEARSAGEARQQ